MPQDEFLSRVVIDPMRKSFYMYSDQGDEKVIECDNIDEFMNGYFNSEKLVFSGKSGPVYGWKSTKERYLAKYSSKELMGNLKFDIDNIFLVKRGVAILLGKFYLKREIGDASGFFTLVFKKVKGKWYIISDHTS